MRIVVDFEKREIICKDFAGNSEEFAVMVELLTYSRDIGDVTWEADGHIYESAVELAMGIGTFKRSH